MSLDLCAQTGNNTGGIPCDGKRRTPRKFSVGTKTYVPADYSDEDTFIAAIKAAHLLPNGTAGKMYAFPIIGDVTVITEADTIAKLALGPNRRLRKGNPGYTFNVEINQTEFQALLAFDNVEIPVEMLDSARQMWFYRDRITGNLSGEVALLTIGGNGYENGADATTGTCQISLYYLDVDDFEQRSAFYRFQNLSPNDLKGLKNVTLLEAVPHVTNVHSLEPVILTARIGGDLKIIADYGTILAAATWTAFSGAPGFATSLAITGVAVVSGKLAFTFDSTAYTALPANTLIKLVGPTVAVLNTAGAIGIEIVTKILTKTP